MRTVLQTATLLTILIQVSGCATNPPNHTHNNICRIYHYDSDWEKAAKASSKRWGIPEYILMAFIYQESRFKDDAQPERDFALGFIPLPRDSSAFGYSQAQDPAWFDYQKSTGNRFAKRTNVEDSLDFIGWYNYQSHIRNGIRRDDAYRLYLAYHEGHGGYSRKTYANKKWLLHVANKVKNRAYLYKKQLIACHKLEPEKSKSKEKNKGRCTAPWPYC